MGGEGKLMVLVPTTVNWKSADARPPAPMESDHENKNRKSCRNWAPMLSPPPATVSSLRDRLVSMTVDVFNKVKFGESHDNLIN